MENLFISKQQMDTLVGEGYQDKVKSVKKRVPEGHSDHVYRCINPLKLLPFVVADEDGDEAFSRPSGGSTSNSPRADDSEASGSADKPTQSTGLFHRIAQLSVSALAKQSASGAQAKLHADLTSTFQLKST
jgi:hypothetical protein